MKFLKKFIAESKKKRKGKDFQGLYTESYKILFSEIKDQNRGRDRSSL